MALRYLNNPRKILLKYIEIGDQENLVTNLLPIVREIVDDPVWSYIQAGNVTCVPLTGGISNILYLLEDKKAAKKIIVRLYGVGTSNFIDRSVENNVFSTLSSTGFGPTFYGLFENGRLEGHLPARALEPHEMFDVFYVANIAAATSALHRQEVDSIKFGNYLWDKIDLFFNLVDDARFSDERKQKQLEDLSLSNIRKEYEWFKALIEKELKEASKSNSLVSFDDGKAFGLQKVLCHNDLLSGNILVTEQGEVRLIDYEYAGYNFRAFDIANHFCEYMSFEVILDQFPDAAARHRFIRAYLAAWTGNATVSEDTVKGLDDVVCKFCLAAHLYWGTWSVYQATTSTIDFDYLEFARKRFAAYCHEKALFAL